MTRVKGIVMNCKFKNVLFRRQWSMKMVHVPGFWIGLMAVAVLLSFIGAGCAPTAGQSRTRDQAPAAPGMAGIQAEEARRDAYRSAGLVKREIQVNTDRIVYLEGGRGETVMLLHGYCGSKDAWVDFARLLTPAYHVVIPDLAGFGESTKDWNRNYNIENQVKRLEDLAQALKLKRVHLAGNSMGGAIAALYAARHPPETRTLALLDTYGIQTARWTQFWSQMQNGHNLMLIKSRDEFENLIPYLYVTPPAMSAPLNLLRVDQIIADRRFNDKIGMNLFTENIALEHFPIQVESLRIFKFGACRGERDDLFL
jgi:pimeloyl-ACP methyl ester carboxylesterase